MPEPIRVMVQMKFTKPVAAAAFEAAPVAPAFALAAMPGVDVDEAFKAVQVPLKRARPPEEGPFAVGELFTLSHEPEASSYVIRATVADRAKLEELASAAVARDEVIGVFADPKIAHFAVCPDEPVGTDTDVEGLLHVNKLHQQGMDGKDVKVAIVDTGVNLKYLAKKGKKPSFDKNSSWSPIPGDLVGDLPVDHGCMCAYDVCIAAPNCTLIDHALLRTQAEGGSVMDGFLSDGVASFSKLLSLRAAGGEDATALVVNCSWGMFHSSWDFPPGDRMNYSDNPAHPFNIIVGTLEAAGVDILFAAGNCGRECPDGRCRNETDNGIYGANSSDAVLSVAGVVITKERIGYSTRGPGRLIDAKPDFASYTHFKGSGVYPADGGTSAATPVAAGVVAAIRTKYSPTAIRPAVLRNLVRRTAEDRAAQGFDYEYGYGVIDVEKLLAAVKTAATP